jgi:hypothetical protein
METYVSIMDIITIATSVATLVALGFTIYQARLTRETLIETKKSIDQEKLNRQISLLPKFDWIIQVEVELEHWQGDLETRSKKLKEAFVKKDSSILEELAKTKTKSPGDLRLSRYQYEKMPDWLSQLWLSGAQYYFDAMASMQFLYRDNKGEFSLAEMLFYSCDRSSASIAELREYISDMVPEVILKTPASTSNSEFFRD